MLERYAVKVARTVLRGGSGSNATSLPDQVTLARVLGGAAFWLRLRLWTTAPAHLMVAFKRSSVRWRAQGEARSSTKPFRERNL